MLSLLLITALTVQYPSASKPATDTTGRARQPAAATRDTSRTGAVSRIAFHDTMRELWGEHVVYTRNFIISAVAGLPDAAPVEQRLLRNQDELGDAIKPYYGDAAGSRLTALLRSHIQLAGRTVTAAKGINHAMHGGYQPQVDTTQIKTNAQDPTAAGTDSTALNAAVAALRANADTIATFLSTANPRNWSRSTLQGAFQMHITLLLQEATARIKGDWTADLAAFDASHGQALQMADMLSDGIIKQFPNRFTNKATTMSSLP